MRSAEFDREEVLRSAMEVFISKGYSKTSMQDLKAATGLHPGSIYCAFTNKRGLLLAALEQYGIESAKVFEAQFEGHESVLEAFQSYLTHVVDECEREEVKDCLLQKALSELSQQDEEVEAVISGLMEKWRNNIAGKLILAQENGELSTDVDCSELAEFLVMGIYGIRTFSHTKPPAGTLTRLASQLFEHIQQKAMA
ncbi:TetR family transcriptional regulator [Vibrio nigripulchritudo ATCC 27043]|uniref:TetR/AcrR family transcriptional regulator n=1 Tax=Vibrio nigripulchritudo TaxID=28173 RepID=UPI00021C1B48|nr:TetR/AcrR family transcriptional regulator [Vibrio nigripulchritudo]EGU61724.1 TetR family transcriptional regulator [Vibrio nigripulchritudo ATCC 27043]